MILNLETINTIRESLTVSFFNKKYDFKHYGITLQNDTISNDL